MEFQNKWVVALRWLVFVPGAFVSAYLAWLIVSFGNRLSLIMTGMNPDGFINRLFIELVSNGVMGAAFVYSGSRIAPGNRKIIAYVLAVVAVLLSGFLAFPAIVRRDWWSIVGVISIAVGAGLIIYQIAEGELDIDKHRLT